MDAAFKLDLKYCNECHEWKFQLNPMFRNLKAAQSAKTWIGLINISNVFISTIFVQIVLRLKCVKALSDD